jgi:methionyl-tRNA synthetase
MNRYITTTLPYVNDAPHVGHALEFVQADALARFYHLMGDEVFLNTGTDEHGQKIYEAAEKAGEEVQTYVDRYAKTFQDLHALLGVEHSAFIRTTDEKHIHAAQEMWRRADAAGDIYKKTYKGLYCVGCELFLTEKDLVDGKCAVHGKEPIVLEEENYFFKFSRYEDKLRDALSKEGVVIPDFRRKELLAFLERGLEDFSISRSKERMPWGIPVPGDDSQVQYVWFDALTNYISTLDWPNGENFKKYWTDGKTVQFAGKDQLRFQSLIWQAMLMSVGERPTDQIFYHGFINVGGTKMSKSLGNVISPYDLVEKYGTEATRYLLLRHIHPYDDTDVSWERFDEWYEAHLVNGLGNLVARVMKLAADTLSSPVALSDEDTQIEESFSTLLNEFRFSEAGDLIWEHVGKGDEYMTTNEPFKKIKGESTKEEARKDIEKLVKHIAKVAVHLSSFMPETSKNILDAVKANKKPENLFPRLDPSKRTSLP